MRAKLHESMKAWQRRVDALITPVSDRCTRALYPGYVSIYLTRFASACVIDSLRDYSDIRLCVCSGGIGYFCVFYCEAEENGLLLLYRKGVCFFS